MSSNGKLPYFPFYPKDFIGDSKVQRMTTLEKGAYICLLCAAWEESEKGTLTADDEELQRIAGLSGDEWKTHKRFIIAPFELKDGRYFQKRMVEEAARIQVKSSKASASAKVRWETNGNANALRTHCDGNAIQSQSQSQREERNDAMRTHSERINVQNQERKSGRPDADEIDCADGFGALQARFPRLDIAKEFAAAKAKTGKEPNRNYFLKWLENEQARLIPGVPPVDSTKSHKNGVNGSARTDEWEPPSMDSITAYALRKKLTASFARYCWNLWNGNNWKHYGDPIRSDRQWQSLMETIDWKGH